MSAESLLAVRRACALGHEYRERLPPCAHVLAPLTMRKELEIAALAWTELTRVSTPTESSLAIARSLDQALKECAQPLKGAA
jgi:hypothetical protein